MKTRKLIIGAACLLGLASPTVTLGQPSPIYTLSPSTNLWDGRQTFTVTPLISNMAVLQAAGATNFTYQWTVDGVAVIGQSLPPDINNPGVFTNSVLTLLRSQGNGPVTLTLALSNGGTPVTNSCIVPVQQPPTDTWVMRTPDLNEVPVNNQFYARDDTGYGTIYYNGTISGSPSSVFLKVYANGVLYTNLSQAPSGGQYAFAAQIKGGLVGYSVQFGSVTGGVTNILNAVTNLVCGDAYILEGQSNTQTPIGSELQFSPTIYTNYWIRGYGTLGYNASASIATATNGGWGYATRQDAQPQIGYWGMDLASNLWATYNMPICMINGSVGGTEIIRHQANPANHYAATVRGDTIYANLLSRVGAARLTHGIRGVLWHQGEQNQGTQEALAVPDYVVYQKHWVNMSAAWKQDFPNIKNYYIFQIWPAACGDQGNDDMLREVQRTLPRLYSNMRIMSTLGIVPGSGCHYVPAGYQRFSDLMSPLVQQDNYGYVPANDITAPDLKQAYYTTTNKNEIALVFGQNMTWGITALNRFFMDYVSIFIPGAYNVVVSGSASGNVVKLQLSGATNYQTITYLAGSTWGNAKAWDGVQSNLLYGSNGIAALTFCSVPIAASAPASLVNLPATSITTTSAVIHTTLSCGGSNYAVNAYWNTVNGGFSPSLWVNSGYVGAWTNVTATNLNYSLNGLLTGTKYYFSFEGTNASGTAGNLWPNNWPANYVQSFTTPVGAPGPVVDNGSGAANLSVGVSQLRGTLANGPADVTLYWGTTDGGASPANWANANLLTGTASGSFSSNVSNLLYGLTYYYRCYASNQLGAAWSPATTNFTTLRPAIPVSLSNTAATGITVFSATLNATLACTGSVYNVVAYWNTTNGGTNAAAWGNSAYVGTWTDVAATNLSFSAAGLLPGTNYYYTFVATNAVDTLWATNVQSFTTIAITTLGYLTGLSSSLSTPLSPSFASDTYSYTLGIQLYTTASLTVTPTAADPNATIRVNGSPVISGHASGPIALSVGANVISIVVVSEDLSATNTYTITVTRGTTALAIYEPFSGAAGNLNGQAAGTGLTGTWSSSNYIVTNGSLSYGSLPTSGNHAISVGANYYSAGANPGATLYNDGLLTEGTALWYSALVRSVTGSSLRTYLAIGNGIADGFDRVGTSGLGFKLQNGQVYAHYWDGSSAHEGAAAAVSDGVYLVVGRIDWGANGSCTNSIYLPGTNLALPSAPASTLTMTLGVPQTNYNWISFAGGNNGAVPEIDEIRFGASYAAVIGTPAVSGPAITNSPATGITATTAALNAALGCAGTNAAVLAYWNTVNGGTNAALWTNSVYVGAWTNVASTNISYTATGVAPNTTYYFTFRATNSAYSVWATNVLSFTTLSAAPGPVMDNGAGASNLAVGMAQLRGTLTNGPADVRFYWGSADGGTSAGSWANVFLVTNASSGALSANVSNLLYGVTYYYRCYASNANGMAWAPTTASFTTLRPALGCSLTNAPATGITATSVALNATLGCTGAVYSVVACWNTTNGGTNAAAWTNSAYVGSWTNVVSTSLTYAAAGLLAGTTYYFTFRATNAVDTLWATNVLSFTTAKSAYLTSLAPSAGTLSPAFASGTFSYTATVPYPTTNMTVTPTAADPLATIRVNGSLVLSGNPSGLIALGVGANVITNVVVSQDATATNTYTLTVTRAAPISNADLANLVPSAGTLTPAFASGTLSYTASVSYATASLTVTPTAADATATITVNGNPVASGSPSGAIALNVGASVITTVVTAQDGVTVKTYTLTVTRAAFVPVLIYEPFAQTAGNLNGQAAGTGFTGNWTATGGQGVTAGGNLSWGGLPTSGNCTTNSSGNFYHAWANPGTTLSDAGLLNDGATLWWSALIWSTNVSGQTARTYLTIGTGYPDGFDRVTASPTAGGNAGRGIGVKLLNGNVYAHYWNGSGAVEGGAQAISNGVNLVVGRIDWGASGTTPTTISIFLPGTDLALPATAASTESMIVTQSTFGTIGFAGGSIAPLPEIDEIRFGATYASVIGAATAGPPAITNSPATGVTTTAATLNATLSCAGTNAAVLAYWNTVNGGTDAALWPNSAYVGTCTNVVSTNLSFAVANLLPNTAYYFTFRATNALDSLWATNVQTFTTLSPPGPVVDNGVGATNLAVGVAQLRGTLANGPADVRLYWGTSDGGTNFGLWTSGFGLPSVPSGGFSGNVSNLLYGLTYYYRTYASNQWGTEWASATTNFTTLRPSSSLVNSAATGVASTAAGLNAALTCTGAVYNVVVFWDTADDGTNATAWANSAALGCWTNVAVTNLSFSANALTPSTAYYFTFLATNALDTLWATNVQSFATLAATAPPIPVLPVSGVAVTNGVPAFTFTAARGCMYRLDYKNLLTDADWGCGDWSTNASGGDVQMTLTDTGAIDQPQRFYRLEAAYP